MKKFLLALMCLSLFITSCNETSASETNSTTVQSADVQSVEQSTSEFIIDESTVLKTSSWNQQVLDMLYVNVLEANVLVPQCEAESYEVSFYKEGEGDNIMTATLIKCYGIDEQNVLKNYENILASHSFYLSSEPGSASIEVSVTDDMFLKYYVFNHAFYIYAYRVKLRSVSWPVAAMEVLLGVDIPHVEAAAYSGGFSTDIFNNEVLLIYCYGVSSDYDKTYKGILEQFGFQVEVSNGSFYQGTHEEYFINITYYMYDESMMFLQVSSFAPIVWPSATITSILGFDLPQLTDGGNENLVLDDALYVGESFAIYYLNASINAIDSYGEQLRQVGFEKIEERNENGIMTEIYEIVVSETKHVVQIMYQSSSSMFVIAIIN